MYRSHSQAYVMLKFSKYYADWWTRRWCSLVQVKEELEWSDLARSITTDITSMIETAGSGSSSGSSSTSRMAVVDPQVVHVASAMSATERYLHIFDGIIAKSVWKVALERDVIF